MKNTLTKHYPWLVVAMLWGVALLNYMDRQMLSTMQVAIGADITPLRDPVNFGRLMAVFLWIYGLMSPISGAIADRVSRKWLIIGSLGVWSAVTGLMGFCTDYDQLLWLRALMGVSEALYIPAGLSLIADYFTGGSRSLAIGVHMTGLYTGQALGGFGATVANAMSWQQTFQCFGVVGVAYALVLMAALHEPASEPRHTAARGTTGAGLKASFAAILTTSAFWVILFYFASLSLPGWATKNWLPTLFAESLGLTPQAAGPLATITIAVSSFAGVMLGGTLSDRWVKRNVRGRIYTSSIGLGLTIPSLVLIGVGDNVWMAGCAAILFGLGYGMFDSNTMPILCQFVPSRNRATAYGLMNMTGVFVGAATTQMLGKWVVAGNLGTAFALMAAVLLVAMLMQLLLLKPNSDDCK